MSHSFDAKLESVRTDLTGSFDAKLESVRTGIDAKLESVKTELTERFDAKLESFRTELDAKLESLKDELMEFGRNLQSELLRGFASFARGQNVRLRHLEVDANNNTAGMKARIAELENRVLEVERKLVERLSPP